MSQRSRYQLEPYKIPASSDPVGPGQNPNIGPRLYIKFGLVNSQLLNVSWAPEDFKPGPARVQFTAQI